LDFTTHRPLPGLVDGWRAAHERPLSSESGQPTGQRQRLMQFRRENQKDCLVERKQVEP